MSYQMPPFTQYAILGENRIFGFPQKYHVKTTQDTTQVTFRVFQAKLGLSIFRPPDRQAASRFYVDDGSHFCLFLDLVFLELLDLGFWPLGP